MTARKPLTNAEIEAAVAQGRPRLDRGPVERVALTVGDRVWFAGDEGSWSVRAISVDGQWAICTQPYQDPDDVLDPELRSTVIYTVVDFDSGVRGPDNYHGLGYETEQEIAASMEMFEAGDAEVSVRSDVHLDIVRVERGNAP